MVVKHYYISPELGYFDLVSEAGICNHVSNYTPNTEDGENEDWETEDYEW